MNSVCCLSVIELECIFVLVNRLLYSVSLTACTHVHVCIYTHTIAHLSTINPFSHAFLPLIII